MLRITPFSNFASSVSLLIEGSIEADGVAVLASEVSMWLKSKTSVGLDLSNVNFADPAGIQLLRSFPDHVSLTHCSAFVRALLKITESA